VRAPRARRPELAYPTRLTLACRTSTAKKVQVTQADFETLLQQYYARFFPYKKYYRWLSYGNGTCLGAPSRRMHAH
jgi:hypothetical protein